MKRQAIFLLPVLAICATSYGCDDMDMDFGGGQRVEAPFHYDYELRPGGRFELETFNGAVEIRSWDQNKVDITGVKYANSVSLRDSIRIETHATSDDVSVRAVRPSDHHGSMGVKFTVRVPRQITLDRITSSNGALRIEQIDGPVHAQTSNGGVTMTQIQGKVEADTSNGAIELSELAGNAVLTTSNGSIHADHVTGLVEATSSNGNIHLAFEKPPSANIHASTSNSGIEISMPAASAARIRASTSNGSITSDFDVAQQGENSKNHLEGTVNGGGPLLDLDTSNGSIKITKP